MTKSQQMRAQLNVLIAESKALVDKVGVTAEEINNRSAEIEALKAKIAMQENIENQEKLDLEAEMKKGAGNPQNKLLDPKDDYDTAFYNALAGKKITAEQEALLVQNALSSSTGEDGGHAIPKDQQTEIKELTREFLPLLEYVNVETVNTLSGSRNIEVDAEYIPFEKFTEGNDVQDTDTPKINNITYTIEDRGGILPVPNNLMSDSTSLKPYLNKWLAKKNVATTNKLILDVLATLPKTAVEDIDDIKDILDISLDPAISLKSLIFMNQDSYSKFNKLKDLDGNYILEKDPQNSAFKMVDGRRVVKVSNKVLKTVSTTVGEVTTKKAPVVIGDLKELITVFDRQQMSLLATNVGGDSFKKNRTDIRAIMRFDAKKVDSAAVIYGEIVV